MKNWLKYTITCILGIIIFYLFYKYPPPKDRILNIQNYLITVGGIISGFVITFLFNKIFSIKTERENRQIQIDKLGKRLTAFRQLMYFIMHNQDFWVRYSDIAKFKSNYPEMDYHKLRNSEDDIVIKFWEDKDISQNTISLYTAMEAIYDTKEKCNIPWAYDRIINNIRYSIDDLTKYYEPCNQLWYYLEGRYAKHGKGFFTNVKLSQTDNEKVERLLPIADINKKGQDFDRSVIASLGSEFYEYVIPKMAELITQNTGIPTGLLKTFYSLLSIIIFGVLFPIIIQSISINDTLNTYLTLIFVGLTIIYLTYFILEFYNILTDEIHVKKKQ